MANSIGIFDFVRLTVPEFRRHSVQTSTMSGIDDWASFITGYRGIPFEAQSWADINPAADAFTIYEFGYLASIGQELLMTWEDAISSHDATVQVLNCRLNRSIRQMLGHVGGLTGAGQFRQNSAFLDATWTLLVVDEAVRP